MSILGKQIIWAGVTLVIVAGGFKTHDHLQRSRVARHLAALETAIAENDADTARRELDAIERRSFISPTGRSPLDPRIERITPQVRKLEDRAVLGEKERELSRVRLLLAAGEVSQINHELAAIKAGARFDAPALQDQFERAYLSVANRWGRMKDNHHPALLSQALPESKDWPELLEQLESLAKLNAQYIKAPESKWIGTDRRSLQEKKLKSIEKYYETYLRDRDLRRIIRLLEKTRSQAEEKKQTYLLEKEKAPVEVKRLSLETSQAGYEKKIEKAAEELRKADQQMAEATASYITEHHLDAAADRVTGLFTSIYGLDPLFCLEYTRLSLEGLDQLAAMREKSEEGDEILTRITHIEIALIEQWAVIVQEQCRNANPDMQALSTVATRTREAALHHLLSLEDHAGWREQQRSRLRAATAWLNELITHP